MTRLGRRGGFEEARPSLTEGGARSGEGAILSHHRCQERGAALLTAMMIVALVATLAASMIWQQWRAIQVEAAERARTQSAWILAGALDWARLILREDAKSVGATGASVDHLGEPWAVPLAEARLSTFLAADKSNTDDAPDAFLSGAITDAQARYNLTNLYANGSVDPVELAALQRLCATVGVAADVATRIAAGLRDAAPPAAAGAASAPASAPTVDLPAPAAMPPLMPISARQIAWFGVDAESIRALEPYVVLLPERTFVNANTASREVLVAAIPGLDLATAERLIQARQRSPFKSSSDAATLAPSLPTTSFERISTGSSFFEVRGRLRLGDVVLEQLSLVQRKGITVVVIHRERVSSRETVGS